MTATAVTLQALGSVIRVETDDAGLAGRISTLWSRCLTDEREPDVVLQAGGMPTDGPHYGVEDVLEELTTTVTLQAIEAAAGELLMLHACAVAGPGGEAVVIVAPSGTGKTTMAERLGRRWGYVTDETVAVTGDGELLPYPKPLSIRAGEDRPKRQVGPDELGLLPCATPLRPAAVLLAERVPGASGLSVEPVATVPAVALLAEHTSYLARMDRPLHRLADLLHATKGLHRVTYADAGDLTPLVEELL